MSFRSSFSISKSKPRKLVSRSPLKLPAEELARELGPRYQTIDARIGNQTMTYDTERGNWISSKIYLTYFTRKLIFFCLDGAIGTTMTSRDMTKLEKTKRELEEDNNTLRTKIESLLEMLAEVTAEYDLRRTR